MDDVKTRAFLAVIECGTVIAAAEKLGYTPSGISRAVESLERELGFVLFTRSRSGMALTGEGLRMLPAMRQAGHGLDLIEELAAEVRGLVTGSLRVGTYFSLAEVWLPPILRVFGQRYPGVTVDVTEGGNSELAAFLREGTVDVGLVSRHDASGDFICLYTDQYVLWVPPDHEFAAEKSVAPARLAGLPFVMPLPGTDNDVERYFAAQGIEVDLRFSARSAGALFSMVEAGLGVSMNNALMSAHLKGDVVEVPLDPPYLIDLGVAVSSMAQASPAARRFVEVAQEVVAGMHGRE